ncbi:MAG: phage capsid protein [Muribaculaceae bacterium]
MAQANSISAIPVQIFADYIIEKLRKSNPHLACAVDESGKVLAGAVVHIPQAGASPTVVKNRKNFPGVSVQRTDSFVTYPLDVYTTTPTHVPWHEENEISYDKTDSVLNDHVATLIEAVGDDMIYNWLGGAKADGSSDAIPVANIIFTTGGAVDATEAGQTGKRKAFTYKELQTAQALMNKQNIAKENRYAMLESYQYQQFIDSLSANQMAAFAGSADLTNGVVGKFAGFSIMERSSVVTLTAANKVKASNEVFAATDNVGALCWQRDSVAKAQGDIKPFQEVDSPTYYGDIFSALVKFGGRCRRQDWAGMVVIAQGATA